MLLKRHRAALRRAARERGEEGSAFITVIAISAIVAVVSVTLVSSVTFGSSQTASVRAGVQAQASAEQAIDTTLAQMSAFTYGAETNFPCTLNSSQTTSAGSASTKVALSYRVKDSAAFVCPVPTALEVVEATVVATSTVKSSTGGGQRSETRTVKQRLAVQDKTVTSTLLPYGFFSGASLTVTNTFNLNGGGVHTNGDYACNSTGTIVGPVTAVGEVYLTNNCKTQSIAAGGKFKCDSNPTVTGDVTAAGTATSDLSGTCKITGSLTTNGSITTSGTAWRVDKNMISANGSITLGNSYGTMVGGYGRAGGNMSTSDVSSTNTALQNTQLNKVFASGYTKNSPSAAPTVPAVVKMPAITKNDVITAGTTTMTMGAWVKENGARYGATSTSVKAGTSCELVGANWGINGVAKSPENGATVIDATSCAVNFQDVTLDLSNDLTILVKSFTTNNTVNITSSKPGTNAKLRIIVASTPGVATCSASETATGSIAFQNTVNVATNVDVLVYTNGLFRATNDVKFTGAVYACSMNISSNVSITYSDMTPPGMGGGNSGTYAFQQTARYNL